MLILKIIGIVALVVVAIVVAGVLWFLKQLRAAAKGDAIPYPACRIRLEPETQPMWRSEGQIKKYAAEFRALGFEEIGAFSIPEMGGLQLLAFVHMAERFYGVIYDHKNMPANFDISGECEDQTGLGGTNVTLGAELDQREGDVKIRIENASVQEVLDALRQHPKARSLAPLTKDGYKESFEQDYARDMNWRLRKGGTSREEMRRQAQRDKLELTDEQFEEAHQEMRQTYVHELQRACIAQYLDDAKIPLVDWEKVQHRTLAIPETLELKEVVELIGMTGCLDEEQEHTLGKLEVAPSEGGVGIGVAKKIIAENVGGLGLTQIAEVSEPVRAWIVLLPDENELRLTKIAA